MSVSVRVGIRSKLTLMVLGPVVLLFGILSAGIVNRISVADEMRELGELIPLVERTGALVHEIQRERGLSALYLGSAGTEFGVQLDDQYRRTDESVARLTEALLSDIEDKRSFLQLLELDDGTALMQSTDPLDFFPNLERLEEHRLAVRSLASYDSENLIFYSQINQGLLKVGAELTRWSPDPEISNLIDAHSSLALATEEAGLERAVLGHAFATGELPSNRLAGLHGLIARQNVYLAEFFEHATSEYQDRYREALGSPPSAGGPQLNVGPASLSPFRQATLFGDLSYFGAGDWWTVATTRIDALDDLEGQLLEDIVTRSDLLRRGAWTSVARYLGVALLALLGVGLAWLVGGRLARRARSLTTVAAAISTGDLDRRTNITGPDELGILGEAIDEMADHLTSMMADKDQFLASVAHELRTPLTTVLGYSELLRASMPDLSERERDEMVGVIAREASELNSLIQDLLVATRAADGSLIVVEVRVDLKAQATQVVESLAADLPISIEVVGEPTQATGDPMRVRQILRNLIVNAIKYGGQRIEVRLHDGEHQVSVIVSDDGEGIDAEDRDRIFEPYETLRTSETMPGSMGLGLVVSKMLAQLMGGDLTYRHDNGESLFEVTLPAWRSANPDVAYVSAVHPLAARNAVRSTYDADS